MICTISQIYFGKELYMFRTDLVSIIRSLNTIYTAIGICHAEILKVGKITSVYTWVRQMKTINIFYLVIYWIQKAHNDFIFLRSLHWVPTSVTALRKCMDTSRKKVFCLRAQPLMHRCCTTSSDLKDLSPIAYLSGPKTWKSLRARSGGNGGCGRYTRDGSWIVTIVERAVWGQELSCCNKTPVLRSPHRLDLIL
jgi:hypothetical protein